MKDEFIRFRISSKKKEDFQKTIEKKDPNLNMTIVLLNLMDEYIGKSKKNKEDK